MNRLPSLVRQHIAALRMLLAFTVLCGIVYPVVMWGVSQAAFKNQADGSLVTYQGKVVGSSLLCQEFVSANGSPLPQYFQPRPSNADSSSVKNDYGCDPGYSGAANLGPNNSTLVTTVKQLQQEISKFDDVPVSEIPPDAVTSSGSGLDPDISPTERGHPGQPGRGGAAPAGRYRRSPSSASTPRATTSASSASPAVDVLTLNIALDELPGQAQYAGGGAGTNS